MEKTVVELFAGVGGFRVGLNNIKKIRSNGKAVEGKEWNFVWSNQWEPSTKTQDAFNCYVLRFGKENASNEDIASVDKNSIPDHTLLTGGFPCQDYSVARSLKNEKSIEGKKGVLWWQINDVLLAKRPKFVLLENVDRLLKSPAKRRGQAFGIILRCFADAGYGVQWRVVNAADYGHPQRRRRVFIFAFHNSTKYFRQFENAIHGTGAKDVIINGMMFSEGFKCREKDFALPTCASLGSEKFKTIADISDKFGFGFGNAGFQLNHEVYTASVIPTYNGKTISLGQCLDCGNVPNYCYSVDVEKFKYLKGSKRILRKSSDGHEYMYSEGAIPFPDILDAPGRTMLTSEGTANRSTHFILDPRSGKYRILTPVECERLDEFPDGWTDTGMSPRKRYFMAGNALVVGLIETMGKSISRIIDEENDNEKR